MVFYAKTLSRDCLRSVSSLSGRGAEEEMVTESGAVRGGGAPKSPGRLSPARAARTLWGHVALRTHLDA
jgi:hypothetical protein